MKIKGVEISNFRNYYGLHHFKLDKNITILFGENGYGKSTFFDAIEWCITNEIERFKAQDGEVNFSNYDCVNNIARQQEGASCYVTIYYDEFRLHRKYSVESNHTGVFLYRYKDDKEVLIAQGQKKIESELNKYKEDIKSGGGKLIKQSYVLSQDQITNFIRSNPKDRFDSLASIMGINKITSYIDNLKSSYSVFEVLHEKIESELTNNKMLIEERQKDRKEYYRIQSHIGDLLERINNGHISAHMKMDRELNLQILDSHIREVSNTLTEYKQKLNVIESLPSRYDTYDKLKNKRSHLEKQLEEDINLVTRVRESETLVKEQLMELQLSFRRISDEKDLLEKIYAIKAEIKKVYTELKDNKFVNLAIEEVQQKINECRKRLEKNEYALLNMQDFKRAHLQLNNIPLEINECEKELLFFNRKMNRRKKALVSVKKYLNKNNASSSLQGLVQYLQGIYDYVKTNDVKGHCPVCSTQVGDTLESTINQNIVSYAAKITEKEVLIAKAFELQERRENELSLLTKEYQSIERKIMKLKRQIDNANLIRENILNNKQFDYALLTDNQLDIEKININLKEEIRSLVEFRDKKAHINSLENDYQALMDNLNIREKSNDIEDSLRKKEKHLRRKQSRLKQLIKHIDIRVKNIKNEFNSILKYTNQLSIIEDSLLETQKFATLTRRLEKEVAQLEDGYRDLVILKELFIQKEEKKEGLKSLIHYEEKEKQLRGKSKSINNQKGELEDYIKTLTSEIGSHALEFLNHPNSRIQQYYRYLNPMPTTNGTLKFVTDNSEIKRGLSITIPFKKNDGADGLMNARYTLSSAQLNTLAIAIFLVINDAQDIGIFDFVAIDDPIQNMDDVNQYTMCDILGEIKKQLLFSTHDLEFLKLFIKKNDHLKKDIRVYFLESPNLVEGRVKEVTF